MEVIHLHFDIETRGAVDLRKTGVYVYAQDPSTAVWCACYAFGDEPVQVWVEGQPCPPRIVEHVLAGGAIYAHNAAFERILWEFVLGPKYGWPVPKLEQFFCTMAMASVMALPRGLGDAAKALGLDVQKDDAGRRVMLQMCKPRNNAAVRATGDAPIWWNSAEKLEKLIAYCKIDVEVERALTQRLKPLSDEERAIYLLDQKLNDRGVLVDMAAVKAASVVVEATAAKLNKELAKLTRHAVTSASQVAKMVAWLREQGVQAEKLDKQTVGDLIEEDEDLVVMGDPNAMPPVARRVLEIRREAAKSSTAKLAAFAGRTCADGRMRANLLYHGASTGRWSGQGAQLQNLPRPSLKPKQQEFALGLFADHSPELVDLLVGPPMSVVSDCLRGIIVAPEGMELMACDFSNIEGRVVAWLAGQNDLVELFRSGGKIYEEMAGFIYDKPASEITKDGIERQLGKTAVLGCGYGMGAAKFQATCEKQGIGIDDDLAKLAVAKYREKNDRIVAFWYDIEDAAIEAVRNPGQPVKHRHITYGFDGKYLRCLLPSGRKLWYARPRIEMDEKFFGKEGLTYLGVNSLTKKWGVQRTYGGRLVENITQAVARCLLASAMLRLEAAGYRSVLTVHDEIVAEVPEGWGSVSEMERLMSEVPAWAQVGRVLPVAAEGWRGKRYRK
ncbi:Putative Phage-like DNA polymerase（DNA-directed DNA polymerase, family A, palm domain,221-474&|uniref:DNA polymerase n=1 Tax=Magnetospirillum sp. XM-1 TaxID=1663591 RepID=UPI00073DBF81|nr:DNA polymerase [Magnetospirillum sp. XM-1]CUW38818.1 Putative Phage-like DNA polymerase\